jgi:hypothetical protein
VQTAKVDGETYLNKRHCQPEVVAACAEPARAAEWLRGRMVLARPTFHILTSSSARLTLGATRISSAHCSFERLMPFAPGSFLPSFS